MKQERSDIRDKNKKGQCEFTRNESSLIFRYLIFFLFFSSKYASKIQPFHYTMKWLRIIIAVAWKIFVGIYTIKLPRIKEYEPHGLTGGRGSNLYKQNLYEESSFLVIKPHFMVHETNNFFFYIQFDYQKKKKKKHVFQRFGQVSFGCCIFNFVLDVLKP